MARHLAIALALVLLAAPHAAADTYTLKGYRYGAGRVAGTATVTFDEAKGQITLSTKTAGAPAETQTFVGDVRRVGATRVVLTASVETALGAVGRFEGRAIDLRSDLLRAVFNESAQSVQAIFYRTTARGRVVQAHVSGLRDLQFGGELVARNHPPATQPVALVRAFLEKEYPADVARADAEGALARPTEHGPRALGRLTVFVPGLFNRSPAPGVVFRAARHTDRVLISHANHTDPSLSTIRVVTELEGIPVPETMLGRILEVGSREPTLRSWLHIADLLMIQLEALRQREDLLGFPLVEAKATLISHSQGGLSMVQVRETLARLGFGQIIGHLVALAPPSRGLDFTGAGFASWLVDPSARNVHAAMADLTSERVRELLGEPTPANPRWDLSLCGSRKGEAGDGLVTLTSAQYGARAFATVGELDHGQIYRRSAVIDRILDELP